MDWTPRQSCWHGPFFVCYGLSRLADDLQPLRVGYRSIPEVYAELSGKPLLTAMSYGSKVLGNVSGPQQDAIFDIRLEGLDADPKKRQLSRSPPFSTGFTLSSRTHRMGGAPRRPAG